MIVDIDKALFKVFIPFSIIENGKKVSITKEMKKYMSTDRFKELNSRGLIALEDEDVYYNLPANDIKFLTVDPRHVIFYGTFSEIRRGGVYFYALMADNIWEDVDRESIRFAYPLIREDKNGNRQILMIHLIGRAILKKREDACK